MPGFISLCTSPLAWRTLATSVLCECALRRTGRLDARQRSALCGRILICGDQSSGDAISPPELTCLDPRSLHCVIIPACGQVRRGDT